MQPPAVPSHVEKLRPYVAGKPIEEVEREYGLTDVVKLASNENPLGPSPRALEAVRTALPGIAQYPDGGCFALTNALAEHWRVSPEQIVVGNGSDEIIHYLGLAYLQPGERMITGDPSFVRYESAALLNQAEFVVTPLREHAFDVDAILAEAARGARMIFIANPNNPTGTMVGRAEVERLLNGCPEETIVVLDEAYYEYVNDRSYPDSLEYVREGRNVVVLRTFSKIYGLAGLRVGYGIARPEIIRALHQVREPFNVNSLAQVAAIASLHDPEQVSRSCRLNAEGREYLYGEFRRLGLDYVPSQANFVLVDVGRPGKQVFEALLRRGVIIRTMDLYGMPQHLRVSVGLPQENARFIAELEAVLAASPAPAGVG
ncbi:MAG: histidinol-phosphate transaminase [Armatimonadota bacterium]